MSEFLTSLDCRILDDDDAELTAEFVYRSDYLKEHGLLEDGVLRVPAGFRTDFASVPRIPGAYTLLGGRAKWEAVLHDYLYRVLHLGRRVADQVFLEAMRVKRPVLEGDEFIWKAQPAWVRGSMWSGVRAFGWWSYRGTDPEPEEQQSLDHSPGA